MDFSLLACGGSGLFIVHHRLVSYINLGYFHLYHSFQSIMKAVSTIRLHVYYSWFILQMRLAGGWRVGPPTGVT